MNRKLLRVSAVAEALDLSRSTTYELIQAGVIPAIKLGKSWRVPSEDLDAKLAELRRGATTTAA